MIIEFTDKNGRMVILSCGGDVAGGEIVLKLLNTVPDSEFIMLPVVTSR